jgi:hypothetical protein
VIILKTKSLLLSMIVEELMVILLIQQSMPLTISSVGWLRWRSNYTDCLDVPYLNKNYNW